MNIHIFPEISVNQNLCKFWWTWSKYVFGESEFQWSRDMTFFRWIKTSVWPKHFSLFFSRKCIFEFFSCPQCVNFLLSCGSFTTAFTFTFQSNIIILKRRCTKKQAAIFPKKVIVDCKKSCLLFSTALEVLLNGGCFYCTNIEIGSLRKCYDKYKRPKV